MKIEFFPSSLDTEVLIDKPVPARECVPHWFKNVPAFKTRTPEIDNQGTANKTIKMCVPFSDSFNMGYIQKTWCDISIEFDGRTTNYKFSSSPQIIEHRSSTNFPIPKEFIPIEFTWKVWWIPQLPPGYSVIYTHPFNRIDLPFYSLSGVVDSDRYKYESSASHPFFIKKGFDGIIPAGTPMYQIIPFKRDSWEADYLEFDERKQLLAKKIYRNFWGTYRTNFWTKKNFK